MGADRLVADAQFRGNFIDGLARNKQVKHLPLASESKV